VEPQVTFASRQRVCMMTTTHRHKSVSLSVCSWKTKHSQTCSVLNSFLSSTNWTVCPQNPIFSHAQTSVNRRQQRCFKHSYKMTLADAEGPYGAQRSFQWKTFNNVM